MNRFLGVALGYSCEDVDMFAVEKRDEEANDTVYMCAIIVGG